MTAAVDVASRRWTVAIHEAAHVVAAEALGWTVHYAWVTDDEGEMDDSPPAGLDADEEAAQSAVIALAGASANERMVGYVPYGCDHDDDDARANLARVDGDYDAALAVADALVDDNWDLIVETGTQMYYDGQLAA